MANVVMKGIDVSKYQGNIDWKKVKASGYEFAFIRVGWCNYDGPITTGVDSMFATNMKNAIDAGMNVGVYVYSYAKTPEAAKLCAKSVLEKIKPYKLTMPVVFDCEDAETYKSLGKATTAAICKAFLEEIEAAGYYAMLYTYTSFIASYLDINQLKKFDLWIADYRAKVGYTGSYGIWQTTGKGKVDGISGDVDLDVAYKNYPAIIKGAGTAVNGASKPATTVVETKPVASTPTTAAIYKPRLSEPSTTDKYWRHTSAGGVNECILISNGSCLPNCVGYAWGRFYEIIGVRPSLSRRNAELWYGYTNDGYKRSKTPALGAVICWSKGTLDNGADGAGHVAIVEEVKANGDVVTSNSGYQSKRFWTQTFTKSSNYYLGQGYMFQGFILPPINFATPVVVTTPTPIESTAATNKTRKVGDVVKFNKLYTSSTATNGIKPAITSGKITKIYEGKRNPYLINGGAGFVNENCIIDDSTPVSTPAVSGYKAIVTATALNIRSGPGTNYGITGLLYNSNPCIIIQEQNGFGKLDNGKGWVSLSWIKKV